MELEPENLYTKHVHISLSVVYIISETFKNFFVDFCQTDDEGTKNFKYAEQLTKVAHRDSVSYNKIEGYVCLDPNIKPPLF